MTTQLHKGIYAIAQKDPAIHVSELILVNMLTERLETALKKYVGFYQKYPATNPIVQIGLKSCSYDRAAAKWQIQLPPAGARPGEFSIASTVAFAALFAVAKVNDVAVELFTVTLTVSQVVAIGAVKSGNLSISDPAVTSSTVLVEDPNYAANLIACGLTDAQAKRLEGLVEGSIAPVSVNNIFRGAPGIDLHSLFPLISFQDPPEFAQVSGGLLIIARLGERLNPDARCPCGVEPPPITVKPGPSIPSPGPNPGGGQLPITITIPPSPPQVAENLRTGEVSLYLPRTTIATMTGEGGPYPAVSGYYEDNGFVGYSVDYTVAFISSSLSLSDPRATIVLRVEFYINAYGEVNVDLPCVGRSPIGRCWATNRNNPNKSFFEIGVSPVLRPDGKIILQQTVLNVGVSLFDCRVVTIASALLEYLIPYGGLYGFMIDMIIAREIEMKLPIKLQDSLREIMGQINWTVFDISNFDLMALGGPFRASAAISRTNDSALVGVALDR